MQGEKVIADIGAVVVSMTTDCLPVEAFLSVLEVPMLLFRHLQWQFLFLAL